MAILKQDEEAVLRQASDMAKQEEIYLIVSLLVKTPYVDLKENKTVAFNPQGELLYCFHFQPHAQLQLL